MTPPSSSSAAAAQPLDPANVQSDFVVILAALLCALICVIGLIAVARCAWLRRATGVRLPLPPPPPPPSANKGVKKKVLQTLPKFTYATASSVSPAKFSPECAICLGEFVEGDEVRVLPQCGHAFHVSCVDKWLGSHSSCPSCRQVLVSRCRKCGGIPADGPTEVKSIDDDVEAGRCTVFLP